MKGKKEELKTGATRKGVFALSPRGEDSVILYLEEGEESIPVDG